MVCRLILERHIAKGRECVGTCGSKHQGVVHSGAAARVGVLRGRGSPLALTAPGKKTSAPGTVTGPVSVRGSPGAL